MKRLHVPQVDGRYWTAITLASIFGTNLGDLYAHESGLGIVKGLAVLALITAAVFAVEHFESRCHQVYYWLVIIIIRTGATNIADYLAYRVRPPLAMLTLALVALLCLFSWGTRRAKTSSSTRNGLPNTGTAYWLAMLTAGVFGTVVGDICSHAMGEGLASIVLDAILLITLLLGRGRTGQILALYWTTVAVARTAGTAMGDWLAENPTLHIGLRISTLITGVTFIAVLLLVRSRPSSGRPLAIQ